MLCVLVCLSASNFLPTSIDSSSSNFSILYVSGVRFYCPGDEYRSFAPLYRCNLSSVSNNRLVCTEYLKTPEVLSEYFAALFHIPTSTSTQKLIETQYNLKFYSRFILDT